MRIASSTDDEISGILDRSVETHFEGVQTDRSMQQSDLRMQQKFSNPHENYAGTND